MIFFCSKVWKRWQQSCPQAAVKFLTWLKDNDIGDIPLTWNWLEGYSSQKINPKNVHFTRGGPWFSNLKFKLRDNEKKYFKEWTNLHKELIRKSSKK